MKAAFFEFDNQSIYHLPSVIQIVSDPLFDKLGISVWIKRDDLIHPFVSGNKWRKLRPVIEAVKTAKKTHIVSFGGAYSNHLLALASACAENQISCTGFVRGEMHQPLNHYLQLAEKFGMSLKYLDRAAYREICRSGSTEKTCQGLSALGHSFDPGKTLFLPEGGASEQAIRGCEDIVTELVLQCKELNIQFPTHILLACGTGTTAIGIANALAKRQMAVETMAIVVLKNGSYLETEAAEFLEPTAILKFHHDFHRGGYAHINADLSAFINRFARETGILLDPVYTGKAFMALIDLCTATFFQAGSRVLFLHTGGTLGGLETSHE